jgi:hypothetical protein
VEWAAVIVTMFVLAGFVYGVSVVMLGVTGTGAVLLGIGTSLVTLLLAPTLAAVSGEARWSGAPWIAGAGLLCLIIAALAVHPSADHPLRSALVYAENADSVDAWLGTLGKPTDAWTREVIDETSTHGPQWTARLSGSGANFTGRRVQRVTLGAPDAMLLGDTVSNGVRRVAIRVTAPVGTTGLLLRARGARVLASSIDGRAVDTTRYRNRSPDWVMLYWAVPDSGAVVALSIPANSLIDIDLAARVPGIPSVAGVAIPPRPPYVVPSQFGDVSIVYRARHS